MMLSQVPDFRLTPREVQIMQLVAQGDTKDQIAGKLGISVDTVRFHVKNINLRLETRNLKQAIAVSIKHDLIII